MKCSFFDIYPGSAHPEILRYLLEHNLDHFIDPEQDTYAQLGVERIKKAFGIPEADIHYLPNGTISNVTGLSSMLKPFEGVICPASGHINNYEAGAFEATGHKVITVDAPDGKLTVALIDKAVRDYKGYEMVMPRVIYLTQVTEEGTVYNKEELTAIISYANSKHLYTFLDGARLAMAIASESANITTQEFGQLGLDMFYIGGTKNGGLYGEALVINNDIFKPDFDSYMKRRGAHMGKQRPMSLQFARFFDEDNLWLKLAEHANAVGQYLRQGLVDIGAELVGSSDANHAFIIMKNEDAVELEKDYDLGRWQIIDDQNTKIRLVCSWTTTNEDVDGLVEAVKNLRQHP
jgi:threonine aldolase